MTRANFWGSWKQKGPHGKSSGMWRATDRMISSDRRTALHAPEGHAASKQKRRRNREHFGYTRVPDDDSPRVWESLEDLDWRSQGKLFLNSKTFQLGVAMLIAANALVIGLETDLPDLPCWNVAERTFLCFFTVELVAKLIVYGPTEYFEYQSPDFWWNAFDVSIVSLGGLDVMLSYMGAGAAGSAGAATVFRIMKLLRILRIFRIVRFLRQLYMLAFGFATAAIAVFWVTFLMTFALYVCSIVLVRTMGQISDENPHYSFVQARFGNITKSMLTLFALMSTPDLDPYQDVLRDFPIFTAFIISFIIFGSFGLMALLTGVIMESMFEKNEVRKEEERNTMEQNRRILVRRCEALYDRIPQRDDVAKGEALREDVQDTLSEIAELFMEMGVVFVEGDLEAMLDVMDADGSGTISKSEFRHFILQMAEGVRPMLLMELYYAVQMMKMRVESMGGDMEERKDLAEETKNESHELHELVRTDIRSVGDAVYELVATQKAMTARLEQALAASIQVPMQMPHLPQVPMQRLYGGAGGSAPNLQSWACMPPGGGSEMYMAPGPAAFFAPQGPPVRAWSPTPLQHTMGVGHWAPPAAGPWADDAACGGHDTAPRRARSRGGEGIESPQVSKRSVSRKQSQVGDPTAALAAAAAAVLAAQPAAGTAAGTVAGTAIAGTSATATATRSSPRFRRHRSSSEPESSEVPRRQGTDITDDAPPRRALGGGRGQEGERQAEAPGAGSAAGRGDLREAERRNMTSAAPMTSVAPASPEDGACSQSRQVGSAWQLPHNVWRGAADAAAGGAIAGGPARGGAAMSGVPPIGPGGAYSVGGASGLPPASALTALLDELTRGQQRLMAESQQMRAAFVEETSRLRGIVVAAEGAPRRSVSVASDGADPPPALPPAVPPTPTAAAAPTATDTVSCTSQTPPPADIGDEAIVARASSVDSTTGAQ